MNNSSTILVVDDDQRNREMLAEALSQAGFEVDMASDGVEALSKANEVSYDALLSSPAQSPREPEDSKLRRIRFILTHLETKLLILDDFFNIGAGTPTQRRKFLNALRNLSNQLRISIVIAGTSETLNILSTDPSIANRFKPVFLPRWGVERMSEFAQFVATYEQYLFLGKPCSILNEADLRKLMVLSEQLLGEAVGVLRLLAEHAVKSGSESIHGAMLSREYVSKLGWVLPSERTKYRA